MTTNKWDFDNPLIVSNQGVGISQLDFNVGGNLKLLSLFNNCSIKIFNLLDMT